MQTPTRRIAYLTVLASGLGFAGGGAAWLLLKAIGLLTNLALFHRFGWAVPSLGRYHHAWWLFVAAAGGAMIVALLARWAPAIRGHGIPEAMEAILEKQSRIAPRTAIAKPISAAIAIGTGGPFGAEGPIIVTGGALGSLVGQVLHVTPSERKILLASGAAAGMAATFGSPLAAVVLALEVLLFEFSTRAFIPLVVAATVADGVHIVLFGSGPLFRVPHHDFAGLGKLPLYAVLGLACGVLAIVVTKGLFLVEDGYRRLPVPQLWHPLIGAVGFAAIGLGVPAALGVGYDQIGRVLTGRLAVTTLTILLVAKLGAWWLALASGTSGGTLAPMLLIGGSFGGIAGAFAAHLFPSAHLQPGAFALVAMAATFGASTRATFASIVFLFELTQDYRIILPLMLASVLASLVAGAFLKDSVFTEKLSRRGLRVSQEYSVDLLRSTLVREVMSREVRTIPAVMTIAEARTFFRSGEHSAYPVVGDGVCGVLSRGDLLRYEGDEGMSVCELVGKDVITVAPDDTLRDALRRIVEEGVEHLPVVDSGELVGVLTRTDILHARRREFEHERPQPGWAVAFTRRTRNGS